MCILEYLIASEDHAGITISYVWMYGGSHGGVVVRAGGLQTFAFTLINKQSANKALHNAEYMQRVFIV